CIENCIACEIAQHKKLSFKFIWIGNMVGAGNEHLFYFWFNTECSGSNIKTVHRNLTVSEDLKAKFLSRAIEYITALFPKTNLLGKEDHTHSVFTIRGKMHTQADTLIKEKLMRHLDHNSGS